MSSSSNRAHKAQKAKAATRGKRSGTGLMASLVVAAIAVALAMNTSSLWLPQIYPSGSVEPASSKSSLAGSAELLPNQINERLLRGRWLRPDGGYVIEVGNVQPEGRLEAAYFNPRPIKVSRAEWHRSNYELHVFVELRDVNYPGATYKLRYLPATDQLAGDYFQPLLQQTLRVNFVRQ
jgi:hypothetical protein